MASTDKIHVIRLQEWDDAEGAHAARGGPALSSRRLARRAKAQFDALIPAHRTYMGMSRRWFLCVVCAIIVAIALIIGLSVGLTAHGKSTKDLPLPSNGARFTGDLTYYGVGLGACGITSSDNQAVVAISQEVFDAASTSANPNANPLCGRKIRAERFDPTRGATHSVDLTVVDRCTGCKPDDLDVSISVFEDLAEVAQGRVDVTWAWLPV